MHLESIIASVLLTVHDKCLSHKVPCTREVVPIVLPWCQWGLSPQGCIWIEGVIVTVLLTVHSKCSWLCI